jgi:2'-5' RNA ligase
MSLEREGDARVRAAWAALDAAGIESPSVSATITGYRPHVSLAVFDEAASMDGELQKAVTGAIGLPLRLGSLGVFPGPDGVVFFGVVVTHQLAAVQRSVYDVVAVHSRGYWRYYEPGVWIPHCTLATGATDPARAFAALAPLDLPIDTACASIELVDIDTGEATPLG